MTMWQNELKTFTDYSLSAEEKKNSEVTSAYVKKYCKNEVCVEYFIKAEGNNLGSLPREQKMLLVPILVKYSPKDSNIV